jgi:hypothetical protein
MKVQALILLLILLSFISKGQCNCQKISRDDGTVVTQCNPVPVAYNDQTQVGLAVASNGEQKFVTITVRFKGSAQKIIGNLTIRLKDNNMITLELINSELSLIGNSEVAQGVFSANKSDLIKLKKAGIKTLSFELQDKLLRTFEATSNSGVLKTQIGCL